MSDDFFDAIDRAQRVTAGDVGSPFSALNQGRNAFIPGRAKGVPELDYDAHLQVFIMPNDSGEYEDVMNRILSGEAILRYEDRTWSKEGDFMVACCWLTPKHRPVQAVNVDAGEEEPELKPKKLP